VSFPNQYPKNENPEITRPTTADKVVTRAKRDVTAYLSFGKNQFEESFPIQFMTKGVPIPVIVCPMINQTKW